MNKLYREYGWSMLLLSASLVLVLVLLIEWGFARHESSAIKARMVVKPQVALTEPLADEKSFTLPEVDKFSAMTERPLFLEGRRPAPEEVAAEQPAPVETKPLTLKLMGVVVTPKEKTALLVDEQGKYKRVRKGSTVNGWKLFEVYADHVTMEQGSEHKDLPLLKPKPKTAAQQQALRPTGKAIVKGPGETGGEEGEEADVTDESDAADESSDEDVDEITESDEEASDE